MTLRQEHVHRQLECDNRHESSRELRSTSTAGTSEFEVDWRRSRIGCPIASCGHKKDLEQVSTCAEKLVQTMALDILADDLLSPWAVCIDPSAVVYTISHVSVSVAWLRMHRMVIIQVAGDARRRTRSSRRSLLNTSRPVDSSMKSQSNSEW